MKQVLQCLLVFAAFSALAEKQPLSRYQTIIDRQMFGPVPEGFDPNKLPSEVQKSSASEKELTKEQEQLKSAIHFSVINVTADGQTEVGFTDQSDPKSPRHYFLKVGEARDGWTVKEADPEKATMTVVKGEIEVSLSLGGNSAKDGGTSKTGSLSLPAAGSQRHSGLLTGGARDLRTRRQQAKQAEQAAAAKLREEQAVKEAERLAREEQERRQHEAERAEQRQQLLAIQEELKKVREAKAAVAKSENGGEGGANNDAE